MKYKKELKEAFKDVDFMEAVHEAKKESTLLLEEQGVTTLSILLSETLIDFIQHPEKMEKCIS
ncbi:MAG: hypothetical protein HXS48_04585 [Theionarchaea archaeon]|nr:MAG: hypothetical protein AYK19_10185 [Theionarchaea archaeon DG-70-1]MBU7026198.1 hypothetical protein [Theionarchaea archaeon]